MAKTITLSDKEISILDDILTEKVISLEADNRAVKNQQIADYIWGYNAQIHEIIATIRHQINEKEGKKPSPKEVSRDRLFTHRCIKCADYKNENTEMTRIKNVKFICNKCLKEE
jgi:hypothetical protein